MPSVSAATRLLAAAVMFSLPSMTRAEGSTITGKVDVTPAKYLEDTVVYLKAVPGTYAPKTLAMDQKGMKFIPRVMALTQGDTVKFLNSDAVAHNVYTPDGEGYNLGTFAKGGSASYTFKKTGVYTQLCSLHPEMLAYIFVGQNPYSAAVDAKGNYTIKDVPPGTWQLAVWNANKLHAADETVTVTAGKTVVQNLAVKR
jgi:plastocyanin